MSDENGTFGVQWCQTQANINRNRRMVVFTDEGQRINEWRLMMRPVWDARRADGW
jgi:hypothetical protein